MVIINMSGKLFMTTGYRDQNEYSKHVVIIFIK